MYAFCTIDNAMNANLHAYLTIAAGKFQRRARPRNISMRADSEDYVKLQEAVNAELNVDSSSSSTPSHSVDKGDMRASSEIHSPRTQGSGDTLKIPGTSVGGRPRSGPDPLTEKANFSASTPPPQGRKSDYSRNRPKHG